jgi:hypothetical protein
MRSRVAATTWRCLAGGCAPPLALFGNVMMMMLHVNVTAVHVSRPLWGIRKCGPCEDCILLDERTKYANAKALFMWVALSRVAATPVPTRAPVRRV